MSAGPYPLPGGSYVVGVCLTHGAYSGTRCPSCSTAVSVLGVSADMFERAEIRWASAEDAEITVSARDLARAGREMSSLEARLVVAERERDEYRTTAGGCRDSMYEVERLYFEQRTRAEAAERELDKIRKERDVLRQGLIAHGRRRQARTPPRTGARYEGETGGEAA